MNWVANRFPTCMFDHSREFYYGLHTVSCFLRAPSDKYANAQRTCARKCNVFVELGVVFY